MAEQRGELPGLALGEPDARGARRACPTVRSCTGPPSTPRRRRGTTPTRRRGPGRCRWTVRARRRCLPMIASCAACMAARDSSSTATVASRLSWVTRSSWGRAGSLTAIGPIATGRSSTRSSASINGWLSGWRLTRSWAPDSRASVRSLSPSKWADISTTGTFASCGSRRMAAQSSNPSSPGISTSLTTASGDVPGAAASAASPSSLAVTRNPASASWTPTSLRWTGSSSDHHHVAVRPAEGLGSAGAGSQVRTAPMSVAVSTGFMSAASKPWASLRASSSSRWNPGIATIVCSRPPGSARSSRSELEARRCPAARRSCSTRSTALARQVLEARSARRRPRAPDSPRPRARPGRSCASSGCPRPRGWRVGSRRSLRRVCQVLARQARQRDRCRSAWRCSRRSRPRAPAPRRPSSRRR